MAPLRAPLLILPESIQVVFAVLPQAHQEDIQLSPVLRIKAGQCYTRRGHCSENVRKVS